MGDPHTTTMRISIITIVGILAVGASAHILPLGEEVSMENIFWKPETTPQEPKAIGLLEHMKNLQRDAPSSVAAHVEQIAKHVMLLQSGADKKRKKAYTSKDRKAFMKAYKHDNAAEKKERKTILEMMEIMESQLRTDHKTDERRLKAQVKIASGIIVKNVKKSIKKAHGYRAKTCVAERVTKYAYKRCQAAKKKRLAFGKGKMCKDADARRATMEDLDVDQASPTMGGHLRRAWGKAKTIYTKLNNNALKLCRGIDMSGLDDEEELLQAARPAQRSTVDPTDPNSFIQDQERVKTKMKAGVKAEPLNKAKLHLAKAMTAFRMAIKLEPKNVANACKAQHAEYDALKKDIAMNVDQRKQVYKSTRAIKCYVHHIFHNSVAEKCMKKPVNLRQWDIKAGKLPRCPHVPSLTNKMGPANFYPSRKSCKKIKAMVVEFVDTRLIVASENEDSWLAPASVATPATNTPQVTSTSTPPVTTTMTLTQMMALKSKKPSEPAKKVVEGPGKSKHDSKKKAKHHDTAEGEEPRGAKRVAAHMINSMKQRVQRWKKRAHEANPRLGPFPKDKHIAPHGPKDGKLKRQLKAEGH